MKFVMFLLVFTAMVSFNALCQDATDSDMNLVAKSGNAAKPVDDRGQIKPTKLRGGHCACFGEYRRPKPWTKNLAIGAWNVTSLGGKEPELMKEVERYRLEIVGLASTHSLGSGTQLLERGKAQRGCQCKMANGLSIKERGLCVKEGIRKYKDCKNFLLKNKNPLSKSIVIPI